MTTTVTKDNQVGIPQEIVREFGIHPGTQLEWTRNPDHSIRVVPLKSRGERSRELLGAGRKWLKPGESAVEELIRERQRDDELDRQD